MRFVKIPSLLLALVLQLMPLSRVFIATAPATGSSFAIVSTWIAGAVALLGGFQAVSGASTVITSATTAKGTNGVAFSYRITTGPEVANTFAATPLPTGLAVNTSSGRITGTPTVEGVFVVHLTASDNGQASRTVHADMTLTIVASSGGGGTAPSITTQPQSLTVTNGGNATFTVAASGTAPLAYQWRLNGANVSGATSSALALAGVTTSQAGNYSAVVANASGSVTSSVAALTVLVPPSISTQPVSKTVTAGGNATFTVTASGTAPLSYQWRLNGANLSGATSSALALTAVTTNQAGAYTVVVGNSAGAATSAAATLTVNPAPVAPAITTQPANQTVMAGGNASFTVVANGTAPLSYQWRLNGANLSGATSSTLVLTGVATNQAGAYSVVVTNPAGSTTSGAATLTVNLTPVAPAITTQPQSLTVTAGGTATFTIVASGTAPLSYQWRLNGANVSGATSSTLTLTGVATNQTGTYSVVVTNPVGSATSSAATLTVNPAPVGPTITSQPVSQTVTAGGNATFTVVVSGTAPLTYQWRLNGANLSGATGSTLALTGLATNQSGAYSVVISNPAGSATSTAAILTVTPAPVAPTITAQPANQSVSAGGSATFTVVASGTAPLSYQWQRDGANLSGETSSMLTLNGVTTNQAGAYTVLVSNPVGSVASAPATLTIPTVTLNHVPTVTGIANQFVVPNTATAPIPFAIGDVETAASNLTVWATSTNQLIVPNHYAVLGGSGSSRTVKVYAYPRRVGQTDITLHVSDGLATNRMTFHVDVHTPSPTLATFTTNGNGRIWPDANGIPLAVGRVYRVGAYPGVGQEFAGWTGSVTSMSPALVFVMASNLNFQASFVPSPYLPIAGTYNGLFYEEDEVRQHSSGFFLISVNTRGYYSGWLQTGIGAYRFAGKLGLDNLATNVIARRYTNSLTLELRFGTGEGTNHMTGRLGTTNWVADLAGDRAVFSRYVPAPYAGYYTMALPGQPEDATLPGGSGYAIVRVLPSGAAVCSAVLGDGTRVSESAWLSKEGYWPFYAPLYYYGGGSMLGWLAFTNTPTDDVSGTLSWIKPAMWWERYYAGGFTNEVKAIGSVYKSPTTVTNHVLNLTDGAVDFSGGNLLSDFSNLIKLGNYSAVSNLSSNRLGLTFSSVYGIYSGWVFEPVGTRYFYFQGAVLQKQNAGYGLLVGTNQTSQVYIRATDQPPVVTTLP